MPDIASLSFQIDSSQAQRAIGVLETLKASSISVTQAANQQQTATINLTETYGRSRDQLMRLADQTKSYEGTLQGLVTRLSSLREAMNQTQQTFSAYGQMLTQATAQATAFNSTVDGLDRYASKARELRMQTVDIATGFERITAALKNQTIEGHNARIAIEQLGVSLAGIGPERPDALVQRITDRLRSYRTTAGTLAAAQQVFGPSFDAQALIGLQSQPYIPFRQAQQTEITRTTQAQIDAITAANQRRDTTTQRQEDTRRDLGANYVQDPTFIGRLLGFNPIGDIGRMFTQSREQERTELERIRNLPPDQRRQYTTLATQAGDEAQTGYLGQTWRQATSGQFSAQQADIASRFEAERQQGFWGALGRRAVREVGIIPGLQGTGLYEGPQTADQRRITPFETFEQRQAAGKTLEGFGDTSFSNIAQLQETLRRFGSPDTLTTYQRAFGGAEGQRRQTNQLASLQQQLLYAKTPEQRLIDDQRSEELVAAMPVGERALGRYRQDQTRELTGTRGGALSLAQQRAIEGRFSSGVGIQLQQSSEETQRQIGFHKQLAEEMSNGRAAAEDYTRAWSVFQEALKAGAGDERAAQQAIEAVNLALQQRVTQGRAATQALKEENDIRQQQIQLATRNANADPVTRRVQELQLGIKTDIEQQITAGTLPNPAGGSFSYRDANGNLVTRTAAGPAEASQVIDERRQEMQRQIAGGGVRGAQGITEATQQQVRDNQTIADIMAKQGVSLEKASEIYKTQQQFVDALAKAEMDRTGEATRRVQEEMKATEEYRRQADITKNINDNLQAAREAAQGGEVERLIRGLQIGDQPFARDFLTRLNQAQGAGAGAPTGGANNLVGLRPVGATVGFQSFATPEASIEAGVRQLQINRSQHGRITLADQIRRWAPPNENDTEKYIARVEALTGLKRTDSIDPSDPAIAQKVIAAISQVETGHAPDPGVVSRGVGMAFHTAPPPTAGAPAQPASIPAAPPVTGAQQNLDQQMSTLLQQLHLSDDQGIDILKRGLQDLRAGRPVDLSYMNLPTDQETALRSAITKTFEQINEGQTTQVANAGQQLAARLAALRRQGALAGQPGAQRLAGLTPDLSIADPATRERELEQRRQDLQGQQTLAGQNLIAGGRQAIEDQNRMLQASSGTLGGYAQRMREAAAAQQADAEARQNNLGTLEREQRYRQLLTEQLGKQRQALNEQVKQMQEEDEVQAALNARGPFASQADLRRTASATRLAQEARDDPQMAATPEFQRKVAQEAAHQNVLDATERMNELRDAAHSATGAIGEAFEAMVVRGEKGVDVAKRLGTALSDIALRTFVLKPMERAMDSLMSSLFGGGTPENTAKNTVGGGVPGIPGAPANDNSILGKVAGAAVGAVGLGGSTTNAQGMPIDTGANAVRVVLVSSTTGQSGGALDKLIGQAGDDASGTVTGKTGGSGAGGLFGAIGRLFGGDGSKGDGSSSGAGASSSGGQGGSSGTSGGTSKSGGGNFFDQLFSDPGKAFSGLGDSIGKMFSGHGESSWGSSKPGSLGSYLQNFPGGLLDNLFGKGFYNGGGLAGQLFGSGSSGSGDLSSMTPGNYTMAPGFSFGDSGNTAGGLVTGDGTFAKGGVFPGAALAHFENQIIDRPTMFRFAAGGAVGLMGEAGHEAIMPLRRGADGKLGVTQHGGGSAPNITFNITTPNAESFKASQSQLNSKAAAHLQTTSMRNATH